MQLAKLRLVTASAGMATPAVASTKGRDAAEMFTGPANQRPQRERTGPPDRVTTLSRIVTGPVASSTLIPTWARVTVLPTMRPPEVLDTYQARPPTPRPKPQPRAGPQSMVLPVMMVSV